jgi:hypothetical protein
MARDTTFLGTGTLLKVATVLVANRVSIGGPTMAVPSIDKTTLDDTKRRFRPGLPDAGELSLSVYYDPKAATHITLLSWWKTPGLKACVLEFADGGPGGTPVGSTYAFDAFLTGFDHNGEELDGMLGADITLKIDGDITSTPTTFT